MFRNVFYVLIASLSLLTLGLVPGCNGDRLALIVFWDASASSQAHRRACEEFLMPEMRRLLPQDSLSIFRVSQSVSNVYEGPAMAKSLQSTLETYLQVDPLERGTAMGAALALAVQDARQAARDGARPVLLFMGDMADERVPDAGNIDWATLPETVRQLPPNATLIFAFSEPRFTERLRTVLQPMLAKRLLILNPQLAPTPGGKRLFRKPLHR